MKCVRPPSSNVPVGTPRNPCLAIMISPRAWTLVTRAPTASTYTYKDSERSAARGRGKTAPGWRTAALRIILAETDEVLSSLSWFRSHSGWDPDPDDGAGSSPWTFT